MASSPDEPVKVKVKRLYPDAKLPTRATPGAAGFDVCAHILDDNPANRYVLLHPGQRMLVQTGLAFAVPEGYEMQIRPRSGLALKRGLTIVNTPGTLDSDYRGSLGIILLNTNPPGSQYDIVRIDHGDRIAQVIVKPVPPVEYVETDDLGTTERGEGGYGSTGRS